MSRRDWLRNTRGEWYVVAQLALMAAVLAAPLWDGRVPSSYITGISGGLLCIAGARCMALGAVVLGRNLSAFPAPKEEASLAESGVFSVVRHPMYGGSTLFAFGWSLAWHSFAALEAAIVLLALLDIKARREERWLEAKFDGYAAYKKRVKKLIPFVY